MESLLTTRLRSELKELVKISTQDPKAELEAKVLSGQIQTKDVADRIVKTIEEITGSGVTEEHRANFSYADGLRVAVVGAENIYKVCSTNSFRGVPLTVERKRKYFDIPQKGVGQETSDVVDVPDLKIRFTLRHEDQLRKDFSGVPMDPGNHIRILHRKSWITPDKLLRIDMSLAKSKTKQHKTFADILKQTPSYELEVEIVDKKADPDVLVQAMLRVVEPLLSAFQQTPFLMPDSDIQRYRMEFEAAKMRFINPVTMERRHIRADRPNNILTGYTVTNKADGERSFLVVAKDRRLIRWTKDGKVIWTGITATKDNHIGDVVDGEYLADRNLFCIFDIYNFRGKSVQRLPLMTSDDDVVKQPLKSRLGCAQLFVEDLRTEFTALFAKTPFRVETKLFLGGDGAAMEQAIRTMLDTKFEYPTDGLIFTPRASPVAPINERKGDTWLVVYKWKPASQNSIDFLLRYKPGESYDPVLGNRVLKGTVYVARSPGVDIIYPCETITGEYVAPRLPEDMNRIQDRAPSPFQPAVPKAPNASEILLPLNPRGIPVDIEGQRIDDNTIIECSRDVEHGRWIVMRTRYDKTYQYRVLGQPRFGNDIYTAESIWTNIHNPVTDEMIRTVFTSPADDTFEDELYYRDEMESRDKSLKDVRSFHNRVKEGLYQSCVKVGDTLLELAVGRGGDLHKWRKTRPSKVVGIDLSPSNLESPRQGACVRYLNELNKPGATKLPAVLFIVGDMTQPLLQQDNRYIRILDKTEPAPTPYLEKFAGLTEFDDIACQMAIHYACESEESFRTFVGNLTRHGKGMFFGTCLDGQAVYSLLLGNTGHIFRGQTQVFGEMNKEYADGSGWTEEFGKAIMVKLESFERPVKEYLVPFGRVTEILKENGYELVNTTMMTDHYAQQRDFTLTGEYQTFSFLHRSFIFKRIAVAPKPVEEVQQVTVPTIEPQPETAEVPKPEVAAVPEAPKKKLVKVKVASSEPAVEPVFFFTGLPEYKEFSNMYEAPMQVDGVTFPTVEHYYQWSKAKQFGDAEAERKILKTASPKSVKAYGKKVKDFKEDVWNEKKDQIMKIGLRAKFTQHPEILKKLMETGDKPIAEADPRGKYWGIGTSSETSKAKDPSKWPGKNKLGNILMDLRSELK